MLKYIDLHTNCYQFVVYLIDSTFDSLVVKFASFSNTPFSINDLNAPFNSIIVLIV